MYLKLVALVTGLSREGGRGRSAPGTFRLPRRYSELKMELDSRDDAELMSRVKAGDREAFGSLVHRHKDALVGYLTRLSRSRDRAEELAQDAFVRLFERAPGYREQGQFLPYLFRIATNLLRSEERKSRRRQWLSRVFGANGHRREMTPQARLLSQEASEKVTRALAELPLQYRSPLVLREIEGWSYEEIAATLGCREGTVKSRLNRGRAELRRRLAAYWNGALR